MPAISYSFARLNGKDISICREVLSVFAAAFEEQDTQKGVSDEYLASVLKMDTTIILAALDADGRVVGGLLAYELRKINKPHSEIYLYDLAVDEKHRRQGIATRLIEELKTIGKGVGAWVIFVQADNIDTPAVSLYTKLASSVEKEVTHFDIEI